MDYKSYLTENVIPFWLKNGIDRELGEIYLYPDEKGKLYGDEKRSFSTCCVCLCRFMR